MERRSKFYLLMIGVLIAVSGYSQEPRGVVLPMKKADLVIKDKKVEFFKITDTVPELRHFGLQKKFLGHRLVVSEHPVPEMYQRYIDNYKLVCDTIGILDNSNTYYLFDSKKCVQIADSLREAMLTWDDDEYMEESFDYEWHKEIFRKLKPWDVWYVSFIGGPDQGEISFLWYYHPVDYIDDGYRAYIYSAPAEEWDKSEDLQNLVKLLDNFAEHYIRMDKR